MLIQALVTAKVGCAHLPANWPNPNLIKAIKHKPHAYNFPNPIPFDPKPFSRNVPKLNKLIICIIFLTSLLHFIYALPPLRCLGKGTGQHSWPAKGKGCALPWGPASIKWLDLKWGTMGYRWIPDTSKIHQYPKVTTFVRRFMNYKYRLSAGPRGSGSPLCSLQRTSRKSKPIARQCLANRIYICSASISSKKTW